MSTTTRKAMKYTGCIRRKLFINLSKRDDRKPDDQATGTGELMTMYSNLHPR